MNALLTWLDHRTGCKALLHEALYERVPGGARWRYVWGSTLVFTFVVQMITGFFLWTAYSPSAQTAWESVYYIQYQMQFGWLVRGIHHFTAQAMVVLLALHLMQVVIDGAYRAPREVNFWLGLVLMLIVLGLSLTGYLLPWDQKGYWATQVATNIMGISPVVGSEVQKLAVGGTGYGHHTLTRFFALHAGLLPALLIGFLVLHIYVFRRHGITVRNPNRAPATTFWPDQVLRDAVACLAVLATVLVLVWWKGAELGAPADPSEPYSAARPEWYFLFLFELLKHFTGSTEVIGAIVIPGFVMFVLVMMPLTAKIRGGHTANVGFMFVLLAGVLFLTLLALKKDREDEKYQLAVAEAHRNGERAVELANSSLGIGPGGAVERLRNDPFTQGPKMFARDCAVCHRYNGNDGAGNLVMEKQGEKEVPAVPSAADLGKFGTRDWVRAVLTDYQRVFEHTKNVDGEPFTEGTMANWVSENVPNMKVEEIDAVVEFLVAQSGRTDISPPLNPELVAAGKDFFELGSDDVAESCVSCHAMKAVGDEEALVGGGSAPDLTGYMSEAWLKSFLKNPGAKEHYGKANAMPGFKERYTERELQLLVDWMQGRYEPSHIDPPWLAKWEKGTEPAASTPAAATESAPAEEADKEE